MTLKIRGDPYLRKSRKRGKKQELALSWETIDDQKLSWETVDVNLNVMSSSTSMALHILKLL